MSDSEPICENCILYSRKRHYCALDGKQHKGCFSNFKLDPSKEATSDA